MALHGRVLRALREHALRGAGSRVLVALSGGADSVALLHLLRDLDGRGELTLVGAAHLHHGLRGDAADEDQAFCAALTARLGVPFETARVDVAALAREQKRSVEDAGRQARYAFLEEAADRLSADTIATAHTRDDQAETFLLRLLRGSGTRGLGGIRPRVGRVVRPLLDVDARRSAALSCGSIGRLPRGCLERGCHAAPQPCATRAAAVSANHGFRPGSQMCWRARPPLRSRTKTFFAVKQSKRPVGSS